MNKISRSKQHHAADVADSRAARGHQRMKELARRRLDSALKEPMMRHEFDKLLERLERSMPWKSHTLAAREGLRERRSQRERGSMGLPQSARRKIIEQGSVETKASNVLSLHHSGTDVLISAMPKSA